MNRNECEKDITFFFMLDAVQIFPLILILG